MVRNRIALVLVIAGLAIALVEMSLPRVAAALYPPTPPPGPLSIPSTAEDVPIMWRDVRPGERTTGPGTTVRICAAALERGAGKSALVIRFCNSMPSTAERRFAFGFDDLVVNAQLPGGVRLAYDLLVSDAGRSGADRFSERALPANNAPITATRIDDTTDLVFVIARELPFGLPTIEVTGRFDGNDIRETVTFAPLGANAQRAEAERVATAPDWARARY